MYKDQRPQNIHDSSVNKILIAAKRSIPIEYFVIFRQNSNFYAQVSQDSWSCDEVALVRPQVNSPVGTAGPVMFHNDWLLLF